ncbi:autophagy protein 5 isoform X1 [Morus notabilis]|uniref:autophagy protein 5 isoform X1 n=1 Tax=Morus notabilis TaxID=981085 RepID=UPI000CED0A1D|nr:autophagy protein 5 isoform X1 [Morus notabilis]XP_024023808.1 autophagy protein 5 isoform X1 [Morus notabilis]
MNKEARNFVWEGAIPLQIHLHESQVTTVPPPPPALILAPRLGYLPLLASQIKPHFSSTLPPVVDTIWFEYKGLPLKWYIPTGVLFDLLCAEPERPWNLTVHFRGYPGNVLTPCEGEDSIKWSLINSLKEAAYIINGNSKNVMNMSQADQVELWRSVVSGNLEVYARVSSKLKLGIVSDEYTANSNLSSARSGQFVDETDISGQDKAGRVPVRLYVWSVSEDIDDSEDAPPIDTWDKISYINQPVEIQEAGKYFTLHDAVKSLLPEYFQGSFLIDEESTRVQGEDEQRDSSEEASSNKIAEDGVEILCEHTKSCQKSDNAEIKLVRIQGIEPKLEIPFSWVANNLMNPDYFLHICVCLKIPRLNTTCR